MPQCSIYDQSLKFSRFIYGLLVLVAYLLRNKEIILLVSVLTLLGAFSLKFNIPYRLHGYFQKGSEAPSVKDSGELSFVSAMTGVLLFIGYLLHAFTSHPTLAWIYILIVAAMIFLACLVGFCVATLMYVLLRNKFYPKP